MEHSLPPHIERALRRLLKLLRSAPAEITTPAQHAASMDDQGARAAHLDRISDWLYADWYVALQNVEAAAKRIHGRDKLAPALRASVAAATRWERGWVVAQSASSGVCVAGRAGQVRTFHPGQYANLARAGMPVVPGDHIAVSELVEWVDEPTRYWCLRSWYGEPRGLLNRLYFSVCSDQVGYVLREVTTALDSLKLRYTLKCPENASAYARVDSVVVYLEAETWPATSPAIQALAKRVKAYVRTGVPPLTKQLGPGVGFAESPETNQSFGESRCRALAPGVLAVLQDGRSSTDKGLCRLIDALEGAGIDPARPWQRAVNHEHNQPEPR